MTRSLSMFTVSPKSRNRLCIPSGDEATLSVVVPILSKLYIVGLDYVKGGAGGAGRATFVNRPPDV